MSATFQLADRVLPDQCRGEGSRGGFLVGGIGRMIDGIDLKFNSLSKVFMKVLLLYVFIGQTGLFISNDENPDLKILG